MSTIPVSEIVSVVPGVLSAGGDALVMNGLVLTGSTRPPVGTVQAFATAADVATYFGASSAEAAIANIYFAGFNNSTQLPGSILFAQYNQADVPAYLRGGNISGVSLATIQALVGSLSIVVDGYTHSAASINLSAATSFSSAAGLIQTALNASEPVLAHITGSISGTVLSVTNVASGSLTAGQTVTGTGSVQPGTVILSQLSGVSGGTGTYRVSVSQTVLNGSLTLTATALTVTYDSVSGAFVVTSGVNGAASSIAFATGALAAPLLLTAQTGAVLSQGLPASTPSSVMNGVINITQNWATFMTATDPDNGVGNANKLLFAQWANSQPNRYAYICWDTDVTPTTNVPASASLGVLIANSNLSGTCLIWGTDNTKAAFICGATASINFEATNGRITFAFKGQTGLMPDVTDATTAQNLIANGYNFYGDYATANQQFQLFYPGTVSGPFEWLDSFINQIWLNNALQLALINLMVSVNSLPYNAAGYSLIEAACADPINAAVNFGAIAGGVPLSSSQTAAVKAASGLNIGPTLDQRGWYLQVLPAAAIVRQARQTPPCNFWYVDGESIQQITLSSVDVQ